MKIAIIHDWLVTYAGAEKVLEQLLKAYPKADLYSIVDFIPEQERDFILNKSVCTSFIQNLPGAKRYYRNYLPLMPLAVEQLDLSNYDLIISSSHAVAKGVITGPDQLHISYVHSPIRYAWDLQHQYLRESGLNKGIKGWVAKLILHYMRLWDLRTANSVDHFIANSRFIAKRIHKVYRRESVVIYPPVNVNDFEFCNQKDDFYLSASRMVPYKKMDLIVKAFVEMPNHQLIVIGDGPDYKKIAKIAEKAENIHLLGYQPFSVLREHMQKAKAFVFAAEEDFGITPVEAQACGTPVIAYGCGGALETVRGSGSSNPTGLFFSEQTEKSIIEAVEKFEKFRAEFAYENCRTNAMEFSEQRFNNSIKKFIDSKLVGFTENNEG